MKSVLLAPGSNKIPAFILIVAELIVANVSFWFSQEGLFECHSLQVIAAAPKLPRLRISSGPVAARKTAYKICAAPPGSLCALMLALL